MEVSPRHKQVSGATVIDLLRAQIVTRATNSGLNNPHEIAANGDVAIQRANWLSDAFADLNREDRLWADTGDKGPNTHWVHCEHIERTGNM